MSYFMIILILYISLLNLSWIKNVYVLRNVEPLRFIYAIQKVERHHVIKFKLPLETMRLAMAM